MLRNRQSESLDSLTEKSGGISTRSGFSSALQQGRLLVLSDSSDHQYLTEIIPSGTFHYSPSEGFTGTASRIMISGRLKSNSSVKDSASAVSTAGAVSQKDSVASEKEETKKASASKSVKKGGGVWYWGIIALAGAVAVIIIRMKWLHK